MASAAITRKALHLAEEAVKAEIRKTGEPLRHFRAKKIKEAAKALFAAEREGFIAAAIKELNLG